MKLKSSLRAVLILFCTTAVAQVAPPKHESNFAHVKHSRAQNYSQRFDAIRCAIVQIVRGIPGVGTSYGTGFYINVDGDIVTASHVIGEREWTAKDGGVTVDLPLPGSLTIVSDSGTFTVNQDSIEENRESWGADIARIKTCRKVKRDCWLSMGDDEKVKTGDPVITAGFPGLAFGSLSLYTGIVSATKVENQLPVGQTKNTHEPVSATSTYIRVQMPISGGLSGSPVIDDENRAIAVVDAAGLWSEVLDRLIYLADTNQLGPPLFQPPAVPQKDTLNLGWAVGELAKSFHQYSSPGYGDSVPLSYLTKTAKKSNPTSSRSDH